MDQTAETVFGLLADGLAQLRAAAAGEAGRRITEMGPGKSAIRDLVSGALDKLIALLTEFRTATVQFEAEMIQADALFAALEAVAQPFATIDADLAAAAGPGETALLSDIAAPVAQCCGLITSLIRQAGGGFRQLMPSPADLARVRHELEALLGASDDTSAGVLPALLKPVQASPTR